MDWTAVLNSDEPSMKSRDTVTRAQGEAAANCMMVPGGGRHWSTGRGQLGSKVLDTIL